jgi:hypothetical protein
VRKRSLLLEVYATFHKSGQLVDRACEVTGITPEDFAFVSIVGGREPVTRLDNPDDGRSFLLRLTPRGKSAWRAAGERLHKIVTSLEKRLDRPAAEIQEALLALQAAFDSELAQSQESVPR